MYVHNCTFLRSDPKLKPPQLGPPGNCIKSYLKLFCSVSKDDHIICIEKSRDTLCLGCSAKSHTGTRTPNASSKAIDDDVEKQRLKTPPWARKSSQSHVSESL